MDERLLSPRDLADLCKVPLATVYRWNDSGTGPPILKLGKHACYREPDIERWLADQAVPVLRGEGLA